MISQLRQVRSAEKQTQELLRQKRAQQRLALQWTTNDILATAKPFHEVGPRFLRRLCEDTGWQAGGLWLIDPEHGRINCAEFWQSPDLPEHGLEAALRAQNFGCGVDLPGRAWLEAAPVWIEDFNSAQGPPCAAAAARVGLRSACAFPFAVRHEVIGVIELFSREPRPRDDEALEMMVAAGVPVGHFFERQRADQKQRSSDERLRQLVSLLPAGIYTCDLEGRITFFNRRAVELWGREPKLHDERERFCGCFKLLRPDGRLVIPAQSPMAVTLATGKTFRNVQTVIERPDGARFTASVSIDPIFSAEHGGISGAINVFEDITELKRSENLLSGQNQALQLVISGAPLEEIFTRLIQTVEAEASGRAVAGILLLDPDGRRLRHGAAPSLPAAYNTAIDGVEIGPLLGTCCAAAYRGEVVITPDIASEAGWATLKHLPLELGFRAAWSMPILSASGKVLGTFGTYFRECRVPTEQEKEIVAMLCKTAALAIERHRFEAERKRTAEEIERARDDALAAARAKDDFLAALSHELRTPLSPVLLLASEAALDDRLPEALRADFDTIRKNVELEARLIDDLLDLTRITRGKLPIEPRAVDAHVILQDALATVRAEIAAKRIGLNLKLDAGQPVVWGDPVRVQQIFWNVLKNAAKFTPEGGSITVETTVDVERGKFSVRFIDTGIGMSAMELTRIFDAFSQGEHAGHGGSHRFGGLGLGLAISQKLVELHDGRIHAVSAGRDRGAEFVIELPIMPGLAGGSAIAIPPPEAATRRPSAAISGVVPRGRILLVEDHAPTRLTLEHLLRRRHYEVVSAATLAEARALGEQAGITLLVSDIGLPDGSGCDLMAELRDRRGLKGIALSGYGMENDLSRSHEAGFAIHLIKPVRVQSLDQALELVEGVATPVPGEEINVRR
jgi:PAS domain S-box-containing protein